MDLSQLKRFLGAAEADNLRLAPALLHCSRHGRTQRRKRLQ